jgi:3-deoxy-7-phosphoheptulonate synthase
MEKTERGNKKMPQLTDVNVSGMEKMITPRELKNEIPVTEKATLTVVQGRKAIQMILEKKDNRLLVITGPCSIHDEKAAMEYAQKLVELKRQVNDSMCIVMRVYFEKPRTITGWKGLINDPYLDDSCDMNKGLRRARKLLLQINEMGLPTATEFLDPFIPQYISDLVSWAAIGARTTESQTHREMASGLSMPVGFKNGTNGSIGVAINAMKAAQCKHSFLGLNCDGQAVIVKTKGNQYGHIVLRGGKRSANYDSVNIARTQTKLRGSNLPEVIVVDCSHANSEKDWRKQSDVLRNVVGQRLQGNDAIIGVMLESNLCEGNQKLKGVNIADLRYGVSVTDACISWSETEMVILEQCSRLKDEGMKKVVGM